MLNIAKKWLQCFNSKDLDGLLSLYAEDAVHSSPKLKLRAPESLGFIRGKPRLREWWAEAFSRLPDLHYKMTTLTASDDRVWIEYVRINPGEPDLSVAEVLEINENQIVASRVYHG